MAIAYVSSASAAADTVAMPTHQAGDLIVVFAYRNGNNTAPSAAAGFATVSASGGANTNGSRLAAKWATSSSEAVGTWNNATDIIVHVYRGVTRVGANSVGSGASASVTYPALTLMNSGGASWVARFAGNRTGISGGTPAGYVQRQTQTRVKGLDTNGGVGADPGTVTQAGNNTGWHARTLELRGDVGIPADTFIDAFDGPSSAPDPTKWATVQPGLVVNTGTHELEAPALTASAMVTSLTTVDLTGSAVVFGPISATGTGPTGLLQLALQTESFLSMIEIDSVTGVVNAIGPPLVGSRSHSDGDWYRIRDDGGTLHFETSVDGNSWSVFGSTAVADSLSSLNVSIAASVFGEGASLTASIGGVNEPPRTGLPVKVYLGGAWVQKQVKRWNGTAWVEVNPKVWDGSDWT